MNIELILYVLLFVLVGIAFVFARRSIVNIALMKEVDRYSLRSSRQANRMDNSTIHEIYKELMCYHQSALIQYHYLLSEMHRNMKEAYYRQISSPIDLNADIDAIRSASNNQLNHVLEKFFGIAAKFFRLKTSPNPRISVKLNFNEYGLAPITRDTKEEYNSQYNLEENTAHLTSLATGKWFIENDIPKATLLGKYTNPRIDSKLIELLLNQESSFEVKLDTINRNWKDYWATKGSALSFYKSTMIIPITFWNNDLSDEFVKMIEDRIPGFKNKVFGFVCFDNANAHYFDKEDVAVGYAIADCIAQYIFFHLIYFNYSNTIKSISQNIKPPTAIDTANTVEVLVRAFLSGTEPKMAHSGKSVSKGFKKGKKKNPELQMHSFAAKDLSFTDN